MISWVDSGKVRHGVIYKNFSMPKKISSHLLKTFEVFLNHPSQWLTMNEAVEKSGLNHNTLKAHVRFLVKKKVLDVIEEMRPYVYRLSESSDDYQEKLKYLLELNLDDTV